MVRTARVGQYGEVRTPGIQWAHGLKRARHLRKTREGKRLNRPSLGTSYAIKRDPKWIVFAYAQGVAFPWMEKGAFPHLVLTGVRFILIGRTLSEETVLVWPTVQPLSGHVPMHSGTSRQVRGW